MQRISRSASDDQLGLGLAGFGFHCVIVNGFIFVQAVRHGVEPLARHIQWHAVGQVTALGQTHSQNGVTGLEEGQKHGLVCRCTAVRLHVGGFSAIHLFYAVNRELFSHVHVFAAAVIALSWVAFGVFVGELAALRGHDGGRSVVFAGDQFDVVLLASVFSLNSGPKLRISLFYKDIAVVHETLL